MSLHDGDPPAEGKLIVGEHRQHVFVPKVLPLSTLILYLLEVSEGDVCPVAEEEVVVYHCFAHPLYDLLVLSLIDGTIQEFVFEGNVLDLLYAVHLLSIQSCNCLHLPHDAQVRLLIYYDNSHHKVDLLRYHLLSSVGLLVESLLAEHGDLRSESVDLEEGRAGEGGLAGFELSGGLLT